MTGDFTMQDRPARHDAAAPRGWTVVDGRPDATELRQVLDAIAEAVEPERIILFGSAARGTMHAGSDVDLLVVKRTDDLPGLRAAVRTALAADRRPLDIVAGTPRVLDEQRCCLSLVYGPALRDGVVAWERNARNAPGAAAWSTLPERKGTAGERFRTLRFRREEADMWLEKADEDLTVVNTTDAAIPFAPRAYSAQAATEKALKALLVAHGQPVPFDHDLNTLADLAVGQGEELPAVADRDALAALSAYGGPAHWRRWFRRHVELNGWTVLPVELESVEEAYALPAPFHRDPADRIIVAEARRLSAPVITADARILEYPHVATVWKA